MTWRPYEFDDVPFYTSSEAAAESELSRLVPTPEVALRMRRAVGRIVAELQGSPEKSAPTAAPTHAAKTVVDGASVAASGAASPARSGSTSKAVADDSPITARAPHGPASGIPTVAPSRSADEWLTVRYTGPAGRDPWHGGNHIVRVHLGLGSRDLRAVVELPLPTVRSLIGRIVGVPPARLGASDLITPVEEGILSFFAERMSAGLAERVRELEPLLPLTVLECVCEQGDFRWGDAGVGGWYSMAGSVPLDAMAVPFRLLVPWQALRRMNEYYEASPDYSLHRDRHLRRFVHPLGDLTATLTGRLGVATLSADDISRLEPTDILLFETNGVEFGAGDSANGVAGTIELGHAGWGSQAGGIRGVIENDGDSLRVSVEEILPPARFQTEETPVNDSTNGGNEPEATHPGVDSTAPGTQAAGQKLAESVPVQLRVEIGRLRMSLRELSEVGPGQILNLHKDPAAPVSLVVDDRVVGRGELVRVEGELGVRVSSLGTE